MKDPSSKGKMIKVTCLLGGHLSREALPKRTHAELELPPFSTVENLIEQLGLARERVKIILLNGRGASLPYVLKDGDRIGLFPPELSYNTFVSLSLRKESVEARSKKEKG